MHVPERRFDFDQLELSAVDRGFVLGRGVVGSTPLGLGGAETDLRDVFTSCTVNASQAVEADMFPHPETVTLSLSTFQETAPDGLELCDIRLTYAELPVFYGRLSDYSVDREMDTSAPERDYTQYTVSLTATNLNDRFARTTADIKGLPQALVKDRLLATIPFLSDIDIEDADQRLIDAWRTETFAYGPAEPTVKEVKAILREAEMLLGAVSYYDASEPQKLRFRPIGRGSMWTEPAITGDTVAPTDVVSNVTVTSAQNSESSVTASTSGDPDAADQSFTVDVQGADDLQRFVNGLPLLANKARGVTAFRTYLSDDLVAEGTLFPASVVLDGVTYPVLRMNHVLTSSTWLLSAELGPAWMISRASDYEPQQPESVAYAAGAVTWTVRISGLLTGYTICARTDHYPVHPGDAMVTADVNGATETAAVLSLTTGTWFVSLFARTANPLVYAYPVTVDPVIIP